MCQGKTRNTHDVSRLGNKPHSYSQLNNGYDVSGTHIALNPRKNAETLGQ
jgi:hypothetical protein